MARLPATWKVTLTESLSRLPGPDGERYATVLQEGSLEVEIYAPRGTDPQKPHTRNEIYFVMQGKGIFLNGDQRESFSPGDMLFVQAGIEHRFVEFTDDLVVWAVFYGEPK